MPRTVSGVKAAGEGKSKSLAKKRTGLSKPTGAVKQRKKTQFKKITTTLRKMRRQQRETGSCHQHTPIVRLVKEVACDIDNKTWLRKSTCKTIDEIVMNEVQTVLRQALDRRLESRTPAEKMKRCAVQVSEKHITGAFKVWASYRDGNFMETYLNALDEQKQLERVLQSKPTKTHTKNTSTKK